MKKNSDVRGHIATVFAILAFGFLALACATTPPSYSPNGSQSVIEIKRADSSVNKNKPLLVTIDGRVEKYEIDNGVTAQFLVSNGIHSVAVGIKKDQSRTLTFEAASEVVELYASYEGSGRNRELNLVKTNGGNGARNSSGPVINIQVDNSNTNSSNSGGGSPVSQTPAASTPVPASPPASVPASASSSGETRSPKEGESEIVVQSSTSEKFSALNIFVDGVVVGKVTRNNSQRLIVPNGSHQIIVKDVNDDNKKKPSKNQAEFTVNSNRITFEVTTSFFGQLILSPPLISAIVSETAGIENAVGRALDALKTSMPENSTIAVLGISSVNSEIGTVAVEELEFRLVQLKLFKMVDRRVIDRIKAEQDFQVSGDVSDDSAVSLGDMLGANIVITGDVSTSGSSRRLTLKALDVKTAQILGMAREQL